MIILGIDPGVARTGWGVITKTSGGVALNGYGCIQTESDLDESTRLLFIFREVNRLIEDYKPDIAALEKLFFNTNVTTAIGVGQARGVVMLALARIGIPIEEYTPLQVKQSITGYGKATKEQVQRMVKVLLRLENIPKPDDAADALAAAMALSASLKNKR